MKKIVTTILIIFSIMAGCTENGTRQKNNETDNVSLPPNSILHLFQLAGIDIDNSKDSLAFLILPIEEACAACRVKVLDSILKYQTILPDNHIIIISANGGKKTVGFYFREQGAEIPPITNKFILDSTNKAKEFQLYEGQPAFYYTANGKVYKRALSKPSRIKGDLRQYFSMK